VSSHTVVNAGYADKIEELNRALFELNEKYENLWLKYVELGKELDKINEANKKQNNILIQQTAKQVDSKRVRDIETSIELMRSELSQIREDIGIIKSDLEKKHYKKHWYTSKWFAFSSLGMGIITFLMAL
jgi:hypothetical protein